MHITWLFQYGFSNADIANRAHAFTIIYTCSLGSYSEPFCQSDKTITQKELAPWEFNHLFSFSSYLSLCFTVFLHSTHFLSFITGYIILYLALCLIIHKWALLYMYARVFMQDMKRMRGTNIKAAHIQSTDATCAKRAGMHHWSEKVVQTHTITHTQDGRINKVI